MLNARVSIQVLSNHHYQLLALTYPAWLELHPPIAPNRLDPILDVAALLLSLKPRMLTLNSAGSNMVYHQPIALHRLLFYLRRQPESHHLVAVVSPGLLHNTQATSSLEQIVELASLLIARQFSPAVAGCPTRSVSYH